MVNTETTPLIVIIDDEAEILSAIKRCLMRVNVQIESFTSGRQAIAFIKENEPKMVISDQRMPITTGIEVLTEVKKLWPDTKRVMLSAYQEFSVVSEGFNQAIIDKFISKPWQNKELVLLVQDTITSSKPKQSPLSNMIVANSPVMHTLFQQIEVSAGANVPIFIHGETGSGKELVAKACHQQGCKREGQFIAVNCANFSETLIESQLFGHKKGAFTGAVSNQEGVLAQSMGGTLFLDEVTTLPLNLQAKLLRVIQEREFTPLGDNKLISFDAQIVTASSVKLRDAVNQGEFREDLYYRLNVIPLNIPPLRERGDDILLIATHFLHKFSQEQNKKFTNFAKSAKKYIRNYSWPGNVRQLENTIHSLCILNTGNEITLPMLEALMIDSTSPDIVPSITKHKAYSAEQTIPQSQQTSEILPLELIEKRAIEQAIEAADGNITKAATLLEVNPSTIYRKMQKWQKT